MTLYQSFRKYLKKKNIEVEQGSIEGVQIIFRHDNLYYAYIYDAGTPYYYRLLLPRISELYQNNEAELYRIALEASAEFKVGKLVIIENMIWASFEQIILDTDADNTEIFDTGIRVLSGLYQRISSYINSHGHANPRENE